MSYIYICTVDVVQGVSTSIIAGPRKMTLEFATGEMCISAAKIFREKKNHFYTIKKPKFNFVKFKYFTSIFVLNQKIYWQLLKMWELCNYKKVWFYSDMMLTIYNGNNKNFLKFNLISLLFAYCNLIFCSLANNRHYRVLICKISLVIKKHI